MTKHTKTSPVPVSESEFKREVRIELSGDQIKQLKDVKINEKVIINLRGKLVGMSTSEYDDNVSGMAKLEEPEVIIQKDNSTLWDEMSSD